MMNLEFQRDDLKPLVEIVVAEVLEQAEQDRERLNGRFALTESEAAAAIGVAKHCLRDARLRHEIAGSRVGNKVVYEKSELLAYLARQRIV